MHSLARAFGPAALSVVLMSASMPAFAQDYVRRPPPPPPPPPAAAVAPDGAYVSPLSQTTQETYVPQSVAMTGPRVIRDWDEGEPIPPGYHPVTRVRKGMVIGGAIAFGVMYLFTAMGAAIASDANSAGATNSAGALYIPGVGPFIQMGTTTTATGNFFNAVDGIVQTGGLVMLIYGLASPKTVLVRNDLAKTTVKPMVIGRDGYGMGLTTHF